MTKIFIYFSTNYYHNYLKKFHRPLYSPLTRLLPELRHYKGYRRAR